IVRERGLVYYIAAFFTIAAEGTWSAKYLDPQRLLTALALYGIFALFFLGVPLIAQRFERTMAPRAAISVLLLASIAMLFFLTQSGVANAALWGLALLIAVINAGVLLHARAATNPLLAAAAMILSWIVIAVWWGSATLAAAIVPALIVVGGFAVLVVGGTIWEGRTDSTYIAIIGHVFLMFVAAQRDLSIPPWPLFAILGVLDLAIGVGALYVRRARLLT